MCVACSEKSIKTVASWIWPTGNPLNTDPSCQIYEVFRRIPAWFFQCLDAELVSFLLFVILIICVLITTAQCLSIVCSITANWLLVFFFFPLFLVCFLLYWFVLFIISFFLLSLALICSSFSTVLNWELTPFISGLSFFSHSLWRYKFSSKYYFNCIPQILVFSFSVSS